MFGKTLSAANFCTVLAVCSMVGMTSALPMRRQNPALFERDVQPNKQPGMVDLLDQYQSLAEQVAASAKGSPEYINLVTKMNATKTNLGTKIKGIAVLVDSPAASTSTTVNPTAAATTATTASSVPTTTASSVAPTTATTTPGSSNKIIAGPGPLTIVTQVGTSFVVVASQGTTRTVTLATLTSSSTSSQSASTATGSGSGAASASSTFDINTMPAPDRLSGPQPSATKSP
ncbi:hypothetical protein BDN70DRAFT_875992, partial [Pholiota conissans]